MVSVALWLLALQGVLGAFDTVYYHEWRARLPARHAIAASELALHAGRDFLYAILFATLPWLSWEGVWAVVLGAILAGEMGLTLADFVTEVDVRRTLGDVPAGERVTHAVMGILYGGMLVTLVPVLWTWWRQPTAFVSAPSVIPAILRWTLVTMAAGVFLSGVRDLYAARGLPHGAWPWRTHEPSRR